MKKIVIFILFLFLFSIVISHPSKIYAGSCKVKITAIRKDNGYEISPPFTSGNIEKINIFIQTTTTEKFRVETYYLQPGFIVLKEGDAVEFNNTNEFGFSIAQADRFGLYTSPGRYKIKLKVYRNDDWQDYGDDASCQNLGYEVLAAPTPTPAPENCKITVKPAQEPDKPKYNGITNTTPVTISAGNFSDSDFDMKFIIKRVSETQGNRRNDWTITSKASFTSIWDNGRYEVSFKAEPRVGEFYPEAGGGTVVFCTTEFTVCDKGCGQITPTPIPTIPAFCYEDKDLEANNVCDGKYADCPWCPKTKASLKRPGFDIPDLKPLCDQLTNENNYSNLCWKCQKEGGIWSAIGCLPTDFSALIKKYVFTTGVGIAGGVSFLYFLYGIFIILTSSGNAEKIEEAKQIITSALAGLLLIIFSIFLLSVIGVQILQLPGFK